MNPSSIFFRLTLLYLIAIVSLGTVLVVFYNHEQGEFASEQHHRYFDTVKAVHFLHRKHASREEVMNLLNELNYKIVSNPEQVRIVVQGGSVLFNKENLLTQRQFMVIGFEENKYLVINSPFFSVMLKDTLKPRTNTVFWLILFSTFMVTTLIFAMLLKSLMPLKALKEKIKLFSEGDMEVDFASRHHDEIADVGNEFDRAAKKIKALLESRQMFMRTIMHELRTPIAKGRVAAEMLPEDRQKARVIKSYERLDEMIKEFAKMEELTSHTYSLAPKSYAAQDIVDQAVDMLMLSDEEKLQQVRFRGAGGHYRVDFDTFTLALKNLLDNAIRYSSDRQVTIEYAETSIVVSNRGEPLQKELPFYCEAFSKESRDGLGLGLYLVKKIVDAHGFQLEYHHEAGRNIFEIDGLGEKE